MLVDPFCTSMGQAARVLSVESSCSFTDTIQFVTLPDSCRWKSSMT